MEGGGVLILEPVMLSTGLSARAGLCLIAGGSENEPLLLRCSCRIKVDEVRGRSLMEKLEVLGDENREVYCDFGVGESSSGVVSDCWSGFSSLLLEAALSVSATGTW